MSTKPTSLFNWSSTSPLLDPEIKVAQPTTMPFWPKQTPFVQPVSTQSDKTTPLFGFGPRPEIRVESTTTPFWPKQTPFVQPVSTQSDKTTPLFGPTPLLTQFDTKKESESLFGSISKSEKKEKLSLFDESNKGVDNLSKLNLPTNKIEGLIFMVCMDGKNTLSNIKFVIDNNTNFKELPVENLWICCLVSSSIKDLEADLEPEPQPLFQSRSDELSLFTLLYTSLLKELMIETIQNSEQLYSWLIKFAKTHNNKKMLWLFTLLKYAKEEPFNEILNLTNYLEVFTLALQTFVRYDNEPVQAVENALQSVLPHFYKTFLLSMIGSSYGKIENAKISELSKTQLSTLVLRAFGPTSGAKRPT